MPTFVRLASRSSSVADGQSQSAETDNVEKENAENALSPKHARSPAAARSAGSCRSPCRGPSGAASAGSPGSAHKRKVEEISQSKRDSPLRLRAPVTNQQSLDAKMKEEKECETKPRRQLFDGSCDDTNPNASSLMGSYPGGEELFGAKTTQQKSRGGGLPLSDDDDDEWMDGVEKSTRTFDIYSDDEVEIIAHRSTTTTSRRKTIKAEDVFSSDSDSEIEVVESNGRSIRTAPSTEGSDLDDSSDEEMITSSKKPRNGSRRTTSASRLAAMTKTYSCESEEFDDEVNDIDSMDKRAEHLKSLLSDKDRILQLQLWDCGFKFRLLPHQPEAVRFVAGLPRFYPFSSADHELGHEDDEDECGVNVEEMLKNDLFGRNARKKALKTVKLNKSRGGLLADDMGLGKTVQSLAAAVIRNAKREHPTKTVIVSPGEGVQNQWHETLVAIGVCESQIEIVGEAKKEQTNAEGRRDRAH
ncbi:hypothetical protein THAOC_07638 [Thalassiosira oceanica]|uniref:SNF2 N-terminal domain-containing protein n=1 Tax=Thalassiosira oceanica TaxID=159749 RepID=K0TJZ0_THAOC|nr:hypothetical protein THAOC_07638 [Thalassiosira oceanica]|eukprot:EJK70962.1 hypothetical protein THAOC_07638 [Thalassiosira oceanica]